VPVEDEGFVRPEQLPRRRRQAHVEVVDVHEISLPEQGGG
jgi:hypothetical protein